MLAAALSPNLLRTRDKALPKKKEKKGALRLSHSVIATGDVQKPHLCTVTMPWSCCRKASIPCFDLESSSSSSRRLIFHDSEIALRILSMSLNAIQDLRKGLDLSVHEH